MVVGGTRVRVGVSVTVGDTVGEGETVDVDDGIAAAGSVSGTVFSVDVGVTEGSTRALMSGTLFNQPGLVRYTHPPPPPPNMTRNNKNIAQALLRLLRRRGGGDTAGSLIGRLIDIG